MAQSSSMPLVILVGAAAALGIYLYSNQSKAETSPVVPPVVPPKKPDIGTTTPVKRVDTSGMRSDCDVWAGKFVYFACQLRQAEAAVVAFPGAQSAQLNRANAELALRNFLATWPATGCGTRPVYDPNPATTGYDCNRAIRPDAAFEGYGDSMTAAVNAASRAATQAGVQAQLQARADAIAHASRGSGQPDSVMYGNEPTMLSVADVEAAAYQAELLRQQAARDAAQAAQPASQPNQATQWWLNAVTPNVTTSNGQLTWGSSF